MKEPIRFLSIAALNYMLASNVAYAGNNYVLKSGEKKLKSGHNMEAIADFTKAIKHRPKLAPAHLAEAYLYRGFAELAIGAAASAKSDFNKAIEIDPEPSDAQTLKIRGLVKSALGNRIGAQSDFTMATSFGNKSVDKEVHNNTG